MEQLLRLYVVPRIPTFITPNRLSWSRVWGVPIIWLLYFYIHPVAAAVALSAFAITDAIDGWLARERKETSAEGKQLDERTDKVLTFGMLALVFYVGLIPLDTLDLYFKAAAIIVIRDIGVFLLRLILHERAERIPSLPLAKLKTLLLMPALCLILVGYLPDTFWQGLALAGYSMLLCAAIAALISAGQYLVLFIRTR